MTEQKATRVKFWMVWNEDGRPPSYRHHSRESADAEAARLSALNPSSAFIVLKAVGGFFTPQAQPLPVEMVRNSDDDGIPF